MIGSSDLAFSLAFAALALAFLAGVFLSDDAMHSSLQRPCNDDSMSAHSGVKHNADQGQDLAGGQRHAGKKLERRGHRLPLGSHQPPSLKVDVLELMPSSQDFYRFFVRAQKPVLLRGAARSWPAFRKWKDDEYLRRAYGDTPLKVEMRKRYDNSGLVKKVMNLSDFLNIYRTEDVYVDSPFSRSDMIDDMLVPSCLMCPELLKTVSQSLCISAVQHHTHQVDGHVLLRQ